MTMSKQLFKRGWKVKVSLNLPKSMSHFDKGFFGIIEYSYHQKYGYGDKNKYGIVKLNSKGEGVNSISWYPASVLTLVSSDIPAGLTLIEKYKYG
jgi:hypothetical protein